MLSGKVLAEVRRPLGCSVVVVGVVEVEVVGTVVGPGGAVVVEPEVVGAAVSEGLSIRAFAHAETSKVVMAMDTMLRRMGSPKR